MLHSGLAPPLPVTARHTSQASSALQWELVLALLCIAKSANQSGVHHIKQLHKMQGPQATKCPTCCSTTCANKIRANQGIYAAVMHVRSHFLQGNMKVADTQICAFAKRCYTNFSSFLDSMVRRKRQSDVSAPVPKQGYLHQR